MLMHAQLLAFGLDLRQSGNASSSRRNDFLPHSEARALGPHVSRMSAKALTAALVT
jgi:hypothetical protein